MMRAETGPSFSQHMLKSANGTPVVAGVSPTGRNSKEEVVDHVGLPGVHRFGVSNAAADGRVFGRALEGLQKLEVCARQVISDLVEFGERLSEGAPA